MTRTYTETVVLEEVTCKSCGITHAVPERLLDGLRETGGYYSCPNGHRWGWGEGEEDKLRKELKAKQVLLDRREAQLASTTDQLEAAQREAKRHAKRTANGVCPHCKRSFVQLARHMKTKHPAPVPSANRP